MDDVQNTTQLEFDEGALLRKQMGLITPSELATALGVSEITLQVWRQKGNGPRFTKLGKNIFYPMREVQHWTETNILERVQNHYNDERTQERLYPDMSSARYKTGEVVGNKFKPDEQPVLARVYPPAPADEIDDALAALIGPEQGAKDA
jgi:predicted DNA-binding transcriptional regulator AlpA